MSATSLTPSSFISAGTCGSLRSSAIRSAFAAPALVTRPASIAISARVFTRAPDRIRTCDLWLRRPTLYPAELRARRGCSYPMSGPIGTLGAMAIDYLLGVGCTPQRELGVDRLGNLNRPRILARSALAHMREDGDARPPNEIEIQLTMRT